jgi:hypothetical protein
VTALSRMAPCYPSGLPWKGPQNALESATRETPDAMQETCQKPCQYPFRGRPPGIPSTIPFDIDRLYPSIYVGLYPSAYIAYIRGLLQKVLGELEKLLGATNFSRCYENFSVLPEKHSQR